MINFEDNQPTIEESPNRGLKPSKKFANGTVHENGTGKFEILDRYLDANIIMLKYKWLTGEFEGQVESNKEVNVNASIWKFKKVRGLVGKPKAENDVSLNKAFSEVKELLEEANEHREEVYRYIEENQQTALHQHEHMVKILSKLNEYVDQHKAFVERIQDMEEEIERLTNIVSDKTKTIDRLLTLAEKNQAQIDTLVHQYDLAHKLIEKI